MFSGNDLIIALEGRPAEGTADNERNRALSSASASAYISGVADVTSGVRWCGAGTVMPHELVDRAYTYLHSLRSERLQGNASALVADGLAAAFPCRPN
ncbi:Rap1a/Tai family immunity protein [Agrobacterium sp. NPDC089420]|uniref:Rap1a/Tai family immunity protein n=1 Tax=Agrobacterium sp. NPDC089420 TaxID=3363918 RepID=UPI00384ADFFE